MTTIEVSRGGWRLDPYEEVAADRVLVAAGAWTGRVLAPLGVKIRQEAAKGYSLTAQGEEHARATPSTSARQRSDTARTRPASDSPARSSSQG